MSEETTLAAPPAASTTTTAASKPDQAATPPDLLATIAARMTAVRKTHNLSDSVTPEKKTEQPKEPPKEEAKPEAKTEAKIEAKTEEKPESKTEEKPAVKPEPKPKDERPPRRRTHHTVAEPRVDTNQVVKDVVAQVVPQVIKASQPKPEPKESPIPEMFRHDLDLYESLERVYPDKYGGDKLTRALADSAKRIDLYRDRWEKENPDQPFVEADHQDEIDKLLPPISSREIARAQSELTTRQLQESQREKQQETTRVAQKEERQQKITQTAGQAAGEFRRAIATAVDPEMEQALKSGDQQKINERLEAEPLAHMVGDQVARRFEPLYARAAVMFTPEGGPTIDPATNPVDGHILNELLPQMEDYLDGRQINGRPYVPMQEYLEMNPREQRRHSTFSRELMLDYIKALAAGEITQLSQKVGLKPRTNGQPNASKTSQPAETKEEKKAEETKASSASGVGSPGGGPALSTGSAAPSSARNLRAKFISGALGSTMAA